MIPIIWLFIIREYLKVFLLCLFSFVLLLIVSRFDEIAKMSTLGAPIKYVILFTLYQIPYILPIAIALSALLSAYLLASKLSQSHQLSALQSSGFSLFSLFLPLLFTSSFLSLGNFFIVSEVATAAHLSGRKMLYELTARNPLILLQNATLASLKEAYVQFLPEHNGKEAKDLLIGWANQQEGTLNVALAKKVKIKNNQLIGKNLTVISSHQTNKQNYLMVENQDEVTTASFECAQFLYDKGWKMANDHLRYSLLQVRLKNLKAQYDAHENDASVKRALNKCRSEFIRRYCLGCTPLSFMFLGATFGIRYKRTPSRKKVIMASLLAALAIILFLMGKEFHHSFFISSCLFILPHVIFACFSSLVLYKIKKG